MPHTFGNITGSSWFRFRLAGVVSGIINTGLTHILGITVNNNDKAVRYLQLFNSTSLPTSGISVPVFVIRVEGLSWTWFDGHSMFCTHGMHLTTGAVFGISTTEDIFTAAPNPANYAVQCGYRMD